jgi:LysR family transcriptional regulator for bpeEF and oprC
MDRLQAMRIYARVAELRSFSRAAADLDLAPATVSESVAALERHLGAALLARSTRRVVPTPAGADYLARCQRILAEVAAAEAAVRDARDRPSGRLRVDVPTVFGRVLLLPELPAFLDRYPDLELDVRLNDRVVDLIAEGIDVAVRVGQVRSPDLVVRRIATTRRVICASPQYLAQAGVPAHPDDLARHRLLTQLHGATGRPVEWRLRGGRRVRTRWSAVFNLHEAQLSAALGGAGLIQTIDLVAGTYLARGRLVPVLEGWAGPGPPISLVYTAAAHRSAKGRAFGELAASVLDRWRKSLAAPGPGP